MRRARVGAGLAVALAAGVCAWPAAEPARAQESPRGYIEMPQSEDGTWVLSSSSAHNWGTPDFVRHLMLVAREWKRRHPEGPFVRIGDMSKADGSPHPPHKTHMDGLTADIFTTPRNICHVDWDDQKLTLELAQLFHDYGCRQILYNGGLVVEKVPVAQRWPDHDNHFHIVIDPSRVPQDGEVLVMPESSSQSGVVVPAARLAEDSTGLELSWRILGQSRLKSWRVLLDDPRDEDGLLHDSGPKREARSSYSVPVALEHGKTYRWRVELDAGGERPLGFGWQTFTTDLVRPEVASASPTVDQVVSKQPTLSWTYRKPGCAQASFLIELDVDTSHRKLTGTLGPFTGAATSYPFTVPLKKGRRYHWRVVVTDAHGNEGASEWTTFKVERQPGAAAGGGTPEPDEPAVPTGQVTADSLNVRSGPGADHGVVASLRKGTLVRITGDPAAEWLAVEATGADGQVVRGFVAKRFVDLEE